MIDNSTGMEWPDVPKRGDILFMKPSCIPVVVIEEQAWPNSHSSGNQMTVFWIGTDGEPHKCKLPIEAFELNR